MSPIYKVVSLETDSFQSLSLVQKKFISDTLSGKAEDIVTLLASYFQTLSLPQKESKMIITHLWECLYDIANSKEAPAFKAAFRLGKHIWFSSKTGQENRMNGRAFLLAQLFLNWSLNNQTISKDMLNHKSIKHYTDALATGHRYPLDYLQLLLVETASIILKVPQPTCLTAENLISMTKQNDSDQFLEHTSFNPRYMSRNQFFTEVALLKKKKQFDDMLSQQLRLPDRPKTLDKQLKQQKFNIGRSQADLIDLFGLTYSASLNALSSTDMFVSIGAGEGHDLIDFIGDRVDKPRHKHATADIPEIVAIAPYKPKGNKKLDDAITSGQLIYVEAYLNQVEFEDKVTMLEDVMGALSYDRHLSENLTKELRSLKPGGRAFLHINPQINILHNDKVFSPTQWLNHLIILKQCSGFKVIHDPQSNTMSSIILERTAINDSGIKIPALRCIAERLFSGSTPKRYFISS